MAGQLLITRGMIRFATVAVLVVGCGHSADKPVDEPRPAQSDTTSASPQSVPLTEYMRVHLDHVAAIKQAVIEGDLEAARKPVAWIADHEIPGDSNEGLARRVSEIRTIMSAVSGAVPIL